MIAVGPWRSVLIDGMPGWAPPEGSNAGVDFRTDLNVPGVGAFEVPDGFSDPAYRVFDDGPMPFSARRGLAEALGIPGVPNANRLAPALLELATEMSDPDAGNGRNPHMPGPDGVTRLVVGGFHVEQPWGHAANPRAWAKIKATLRREYAAIKAADPSLASRWAVAHGRKLGVPFEEIADRGDKPEDPRTVYNETWPTNGASLAVGQNLTWTEVLGNTDVVLNKAQFQTLNGSTYCRAEHDVSASDMYTQAALDTFTGTSTATEQSIGVMTRFAAAATTGYHFRIRVVGASGSTRQHQIYRVSAATLTLLIAADRTVSASHTVKGQSHGSAQDMYVDAALSVSASDGVIVSGTRGGLRSFQGSLATRVNADNIEIGDVLAPSASKFFFQRYVVGRPLCG